MKKILCVLLAVVLSMSQIPQTAKAENLMTDVVGNEWFADDVRLLIEMGIINGFPDGSYRPNEPFRVDEFLKALVLALHYEPTQTNSGYWAQGYIDTAKSLYWLEYISNEGGLKNYSVPITREQMGVVLYQAAEDMPGVQMNGNEVNLMYKMSEYSRGIWIDQAPSREMDYSYHYLITIYGLGIITGYPDGTFGKTNHLTRAEAAAVLARVVDPSRRIYPDVGFTPPQTGRVETEGITFDYDKDLIREETESSVNYYMSKDKQTEFVLLHFQSYQVSSDGIVKFYMPDLPDGFEAYSTVTVNYKQNVVGENINPKNFKQRLYSTSGNVPPLEGGKWYGYETGKKSEEMEFISMSYVISYEEYYGKNYTYNIHFYYEFPGDRYQQYDENMGKIEYKELRR